ncbi:flagellar basal body P-ring formation chaperone FlgA [Desulfonauticus submarinus]
MKKVLLLISIFVFQSAFLMADNEQYFLIKKYVCSLNGNFYFRDFVVSFNKSSQEWMSLKDKLILYIKDDKKYVIERRDIYSLFKKVLGKSVDSCIIPDKIVLKKAEKVISPNQLEEKVKCFFKQNTNHLDITFRDFNFSQGIFLNRGEKLKIELGRKFHPGRNSFKIKIIDTFGMVKKTFMGNIFVDVWKAVPVIAVPIQRHEALTPAKITYRRKNLAYISGKIWSGKNFNYRAKRSMGIGEVITLNKLELLPLVSKGERINLEFRGKYIRLQGIGIALQDGILGSEIKVRNLETGKIVEGKVKGPGIVQVF